MELETIKSLDLLAAWLGCSMDTLRLCARKPGDFYQPHRVKRRAGSSRPRDVVSVHDPLRKLQRRVALALRESDSALPSCVRGFRRNESAWTNADAHCHGAEQLATIDLSDFFGSISYYDVREVFDGLCGHPQVAIALTRLCTHKGALPQGARTSPAIANRVAAKLDVEILARIGPDVRYTRYADDLSFSGAAVPTEAEIGDWVRIHGFEPRAGSYALRKRGSGQYVTGLFVEGSNPRAPRKVRRSFERFLFFAKKNGLESAAAGTRTWRGSDLSRTKIVASAEGTIAWMSQIDVDLAEQWQTDLDAAVKRSGRLSELKK
jgi:RNA-directed DNA polymerase